MEKLNLSQFVRLVFAAGVGVLVLALSYPAKVGTWLVALTAPAATSLGLASVIAGLATYGLHRGILHPSILRVILWALARVHRDMSRSGIWNPLFPTGVELELIRRRWRHPAPPGAERWASQTHGLYCSAWAIGVVLLFSPRYMGRFEVGGWQPWAFGAMLVAAVLEDLRLSYAVIAVELQLPEVADGCGQR